MNDVAGDNDDVDDNASVNARVNDDDDDGQRRDTGRGSVQRSIVKRVEESFSRLG